MLVQWLGSVFKTQENPGVIEVHELHEVFVHSENHSLVYKSSDIPLTLGRKNQVCCFGGKKSRLRNEGSWPVPPWGDTTGVGRERELREHDGSHKRSRNYSRKLRECTPLKTSPLAGILQRSIDNLKTSQFGFSICFCYARLLEQGSNYQESTTKRRWQDRFCTVEI